MQRYHAEWWDKENSSETSWEGFAQDENHVIEIITDYFNYKPFEPNIIQALFGVKGDDLTISPVSPNPCKQTMAPYVHVINCTDGMMWYAGYIGKSFPVITQSESEWVVRTPTGYSNIILKKDGVEVKLSLQEQYRIV